MFQGHAEPKILRRIPPHALNTHGRTHLLVVSKWICKLASSQYRPLWRGPLSLVDGSAWNSGPHWLMLY